MMLSEGVHRSKCLAMLSEGGPQEQVRGSTGESEGTSHKLPLFFTFLFLSDEVFALIMSKL